MIKTDTQIFIDTLLAFENVMVRHNNYELAPFFRELVKLSNNVNFLIDKKESEKCT